MNAVRGKRLFLVTAAVAGWAVLTYACTVEDENPATARARAGDASADGTSSVDPDSGEGKGGIAICDKYGGPTGAKRIAASIVAEVAKDCRINGPFAAMNADTTQHFGECFETLIGGAFLCPGVAYEGGKTKDSKGQVCRSMTEAHKGKNLRKADFDAFSEVIAATLAREGVTPEDVRALAPAIEGYRSGVVQTNSQPDRNTYCACPNGIYKDKPCTVIVDAGTDAYVDAAGPVDAGSLKDADAAL
jgi:hypothetical protein